MANKFDKHGTVISFEFDSYEAANHFKTWLCESGEQEYWTWMAERENEEEGDITGLQFDYNSGTDRVPVKCGRFTSEAEEETDNV